MTSPPATAASTTASSVASNPTCPTCQQFAPSNHDRCPSCFTDLGAPNVREAAQHQAELLKKEANAIAIAQTDGNISRINAFKAAMERSSVVINASSFVARQLVQDPRSIYQNYEQLVGAGSRIRAPEAQDKERSFVGGLFFGTYADQIRYGALSVTDKGLTSYGDVSIKIKDVTIKNRTTFLERNSFLVAEQGKQATALRSTWDNRAALAVVKHAGAVCATNPDFTNWESIILRNGKTRHEDDFIEAHIYGQFNAHAFETMVAADGLKGPSKMDAAIAQELFLKLKQK